MKILVIDDNKVISPADGTIVAIKEIFDDEYFKILINATKINEDGVSEWMQRAIKCVKYEIKYFDKSNKVKKTQKYEFENESDDKKENVHFGMLNDGEKQIMCYRKRLSVNALN